MLLFFVSFFAFFVYFFAFLFISCWQSFYEPLVQQTSASQNALGYCHAKQRPASHRLKEEVDGFKVGAFDETNVYIYLFLVGYFAILT